MSDVSKAYPTGALALQNVNVQIAPGEFVFVVGPSGAGKSTFIKMLFREELPTTGNIFVNGIDLLNLQDKEIPYLRRQLGIIFQDYRLLPDRTVYENVAFAMQVIEAPYRKVDKETGTLERYKKEVYEQISYASYAPVIFISAKTGQRVNKIFEMINDVAKQNALRVSTSVINEVINEAIAVVQPPSDKGKRLKILYGTQASSKPPTFVIFVNNKELFHFSYQRYLINCFRNNFGLEGTPVRLIVREKGEKDF